MHSHRELLEIRYHQRGPFRNVVIRLEFFSIIQDEIGNIISISQVISMSCSNCNEKESGDRMSNEEHEKAEEQALCAPITNGNLEYIVAHVTRHIGAP